MNGTIGFVLTLVALGTVAALIHWVLAELFARRRTPALYLVSILVLWITCAAAFQYFSIDETPASRTLPMWRYYLDALLLLAPLATIPCLLVSCSLFRNGSAKSR